MLEVLDTRFIERIERVFSVPHETNIKVKRKPLCQCECVTIYRRVGEPKAAPTVSCSLYSGYLFSIHSTA